MTATLRYQHLLDDDTTSLIWISEAAQKRIRAMQTHLNEVRSTYGEHSEQHAAEAASLAHCLLNLLACGMNREQHVSAMFEGSPKDLYVDGGVTVFGINWHRTGRGPQYEGFAEPGTWSVNS
jgi:hypothetical protein